MIDEKVITTQSLKPILSAFDEKIKKSISNNSGVLNNQNDVEPIHDDLPVLYITGDVPTKKENVKAKLEYVSKTLRFTAYMKYKLQGSYTMRFPKKNFTIQLFSDENRTSPYYQNFKNWGNDYQFTLKADFADISHARNVVCAKLWSKVVASRPDYNSLPEGLRNSPNNGATDGFPVLVYLNNQYQGIYVLTITKSARMFGMDKNNENHIALNAETNDNGNENLRYNPCNFNAEWSGDDGYHWSYEVGKSATEAWNKLYTYIYATPNKTMLEKYLDIQSAIDYYIFQTVVFGLDGLGKNMMLLTYDKTKWYLSAYDMDSTFGLLTESNYFDAYFVTPFELPYQNLFSELWNFIKVNYPEEIKSRFIELYNSILSQDAIINELENFINIYGEDLYIKDTLIFHNIPNVELSNMANLRWFIKNRLQIVYDGFMRGEWL